MAEQVRISVAGSHALLDVLKKHKVRATLFCTANFAQHAPEIIQRILSEGHELASHGYYHWTFEPADLKKSKDALEALAGVPVRGYRQARMMPVPERRSIRQAIATIPLSTRPSSLGATCI